METAIRPPVNLVRKTRKLSVQLRTASASLLLVALPGCSPTDGVTGQSLGYSTYPPPPTPLEEPDEPIVATPNASAYLPGDGSVSPTGTYEYTLPLWLPRGRAGMQPELALHYSSNQPDHLLGVGWALSGLSQIHRCPKLFHVDGTAEGVDLEGDALCLDGAKMVSVAGGQYRTEEDQFVRIVGAEDEQFTVYRKDGTIAVYQAAGIGWPVSRVHDRAGNEIRYHYTSDDESVRLDSIDYTTYEGQSAPGPFRIAFEYKSRAYPLEAYVAGKPTRQPLYLSAVVIDGPKGGGWRYDLGHTISPSTGRLLLESVKLCSSGTCAQPRLFEYEAAEPTWSPYVEIESPLAVNDGEQVQVVDLNGDGRDDILYAGGAVTHVWIARRIGDTQDNPVDPIFQQTTYIEDPQAVDIDRDGAMDVVGWSDADGRWKRYHWVPDPNYSSFGDLEEDPNFPVVAPTDMNPAQDGKSYDAIKIQQRERPSFVDLTGDGLPEMVKPVMKWVMLPTPHYATHLRVWWNSSQGFTGASNYDFPFFPEPATLLSQPPPEFENYPARLILRTEDRYRQGRDALVQREYYGGDLVLEIGDNGNLTMKGLSGGGTKPRADADINGDGLRDRLFLTGESETTKDNTSATLELHGGDSDFQAGGKVLVEGGYPFPKQSEWLAGDLDGDGKEDLVFFPNATAKLKPKMQIGLTTEWMSKEQVPQQILKTLTIDPGLDPGNGAAHRTRTARLGDFDRDGRADLLLVTIWCQENPNGGSDQACDGSPSGELTFRIFTRQGQNSDLLIRVRDQDAARDREQVTWQQWRPPTEDAIEDVCVWPDECLRRGFPVATTHWSMNPANPDPKALDPVHYLYDGPRAHIAGRGFLGFRVVRAWHPERPMEVTSIYQVEHSALGLYPFRDVPIKIITATPILEVPPGGRGPDDKPSEAVARIHQVDQYHQLQLLNGGASHWSFPSYYLSREWEEEVAIRWEAADWSGPHIAKIGPVPEVPERQRNVDFDFDDRGNLTKQTSITINGVRTEVENVYDYPSGDYPISRLTKRYQRAAKSIFDPWVTQTTTFGYDTNHLVTDVVTEPGSPTMEEHTAFVRDPVSGLVTEMTRTAAGAASPRTVHYAYDDTGTQVVYSANDLGHASWLKVDATLGVATAVMDANGVTTKLVHDGLARPRSVIPDAGGTNWFGYALLVHPQGGYASVATTRGGDDGAESRLRADEAGRPIESCELSFDGDWVCEETSYDRLGHVHAVTRPGESAPAVETVYDSLDRRLRETRADGSLVEHEQLFHSTRSWEVWKTVSTERLLVRDLDERIVEKTDFVDGEAQTTTYTYDALGLPEQVSDPKGNTTSHLYDRRGRRIMLSDPDVGTSHYAHNGFGETVLMLDSDGSSTIQLFDAAGRLTQVLDSDGTTTFEWDSSPHGIGKPARTTNADGTIETVYEYDKFGQPLRTTWTIDAAESYSVGYGWDKGRLARVEYPTVKGWPQLVTELGSNSHGWTDRVDARFVDPPAADEVLPMWTVHSRKPDGALQTGQYGGGLLGLRTDREYDPMGRMERVSWTTPALSYEVTYGYDGEGNVISRSEDGIKRTEKFDYDELHRLRFWTLHSAGSKTATHVTQYDYDLMGNLSKVYVDGKLTEDNKHGAQGKPHALADDGFGATFDYDDRGRLTGEPERKTAYTNFDLPAVVTTPSGTWEYRYDGGHTRVVETHGAEQTISIGGIYERRSGPDGVKHVFRVGGTDGATAEIEYDESAGERRIRYLGLDRNGSVVVVADTTGKELARPYYDPFGKRIEVDGDPYTGEALVPLGFTGHRHDDDLGLVNMRGRIFDPTRRRFLTPDSIVPQPYWSPSFNRYAYAFHNPATLVDPDGHDPDTGTGGGVGGPFGLVFYYSSADSSVSVSGSGSSKSSRPPSGGQHSTPKPRPPPPVVRTNVGQYSGGWTPSKDAAPGSFHSKGTTGARPCTSPGDSGCTVEYDLVEKVFLVHGEDLQTGAVLIAVTAATIATFGGAAKAVAVASAGGKAAAGAGAALSSPKASLGALVAAAGSSGFADRLRPGWNAIAPRAGVWWDASARMFTGVWTKTRVLVPRAISIVQTANQRLVRLYSNLAPNLQRMLKETDTYSLIERGEWAHPIVLGKGTELWLARGRNFAQQVGRYYGGGNQPDWAYVGRPANFLTDVTTFAAAEAHAGRAMYELNRAIFVLHQSPVCPK